MYILAIKSSKEATYRQACQSWLPGARARGAHTGAVAAAVAPPQMNISIIMIMINIYTYIHIYREI